MSTSIATCHLPFACRCGVIRTFCSPKAGGLGVLCGHSSGQGSTAHLRNVSTSSAKARPKRAAAIAERNPKILVLAARADEIDESVVPIVKSQLVSHLPG